MIARNIASRVLFASSTGCAQMQHFQVKHLDDASINRKSATNNNSSLCNEQKTFLPSSTASLIDSIDGSLVSVMVDGSGQRRIVVNATSAQ
jgi:hypothetical protein